MTINRQLYTNGVKSGYQCPMKLNALEGLKK
jgi:hypothetical protein